ncbi:protein ImuB [Paraburkholderia fungorum]|uniref:Y-family DNA polymerase n=1 Tax=Paraburkholderia fungorum TaxID=134537 RepID=UPI0016199E22|nr:DNA polymerase Y family protein [Paraburkholderia fungorum]MBB4518141.1 protein ImuB [Paraburkholderia fungorum]
MQLWIGVHLPSLCLEVFRPKWSREALDAAKGLAVLEKERVIAADTPARAAGVCIGMRRGGVVTLAPATALHERDGAAEVNVVREVATGLLNLSPQVVIAEESTVLVDVSASLRLFGGIRAVRRMARSVADAIGVTASISVAPTGQAAWLLARDRGGVAMSHESLSRSLASLPVSLPPPARRHLDWLTGIGCESVEQLMRLPRAGLKKRCGTALLDLLDRACGDAPEVYEWFETPPTFQARLELPDRIEHAEACLFAARRLVVQLTGWLSQKQLAVTRIVLLLEHERGRDAIDPTAIEVSLAEPTWREDHLVRLLKERLTRVELAAAVIALQLVVQEVRETEAASDLLFPEPGGTASDHARLLELLVARLGAENVLRPAPVADHRPEVAARWVSVTDKTKYVPPATDTPRPTWLLEAPIKLLMRGERPFYGTPLRTVSSGERVEAGWFQGEPVTRDYFVAEADHHICYWIFRERIGAVDDDEPRWYLHGLFG